MDAMSKAIVAITMGDPAGVGPEICLRALNSPEVAAHCVPAVYGDAEVLRQCASQLGWNLTAPVVSVDEFASMDRCQAVVVDVPALNLQAFRPRQADANTGSAGYAFVQRGIDAALSGQVDAVVTAPLNKEALRQAGVEFPGHTEMFAHRTKAKRWCMMQYSEELVCAFATAHVGYAEAPSLLTSRRVLEVIRLSAEFVERLRGRKAKIAVCGLNPHAGEHGLFGNGEEERIILPAVESARREGLEVEGPLPPDTAFLPARRKSVDAVVCMYHDQGHIPVKALAFDSAVNVTLGLPIVRASVDHGTALDIAWQGTASPSSLFHALRLAGKLAGQTAPQNPSKPLLIQK